VKKILIVKLVLFLSFLSVTAMGQTTDYQWGAEVELVQPFLPNVGIIQLQLTRTSHTSPEQKGDFLVGAFIRPNVSHDVVETIDEYMLYLAYRHYFWGGWHAEAGVNTGYYWGTKNKVDGKDYEGISVFWEANVGYKYNFGRNGRYYALAQFGALGNVVADIGPRDGKSDNFVQGNLLIGMYF
jgi:hypothetical protein